MPALLLACLLLASTAFAQQAPADADSAAGASSEEVEDGHELSRKYVQWLASVTPLITEEERDRPRIRGNSINPLL